MLNVMVCEPRISRVGLHRIKLSAHIQPNAAKPIGVRFTARMDNDPERPVKATEIKEMTHPSVVTSVS